MLSYTDNKYAEYWQRLYSSAGNHKECIHRVNKKLIEQIGEVPGQGSGVAINPTINLYSGWDAKGTERHPNPEWRLTS